MAVGWWIVVFGVIVMGWLGWVYFCVVVAPRWGWRRGEDWKPRVAEVEIALAACAGNYRAGRCVRCGSTEVRTESTGLWDGRDANGVRTGGSFWYGECESCGCRMGDNVGEGDVREVEEEEWEGWVHHSGVGEMRRLAGRAAWPKTVKEAVRRLIEEMPAEQRDLVRGTPSDEELNEFHFDLGLSIRNEFGLWAGNRGLLEDCGIDPEDEVGAEHASEVILRALRKRLIETASAAGMERARERWRARDAERERRMDEKARRDEAITSRRCNGCGRACPRYRKTCRYCRAWMGRETG